MHDEFHQLLKNFPLIASKNPQLDLLNEEDRIMLEIRQSDLYRMAWNKQKKKLARFSADTKIRNYVESADRFRDITRVNPAETDPSIEWPAFNRSHAWSGIEGPGSDTCALTVMPTREQGKEFALLLEKISRQLALALSQPCPVFEDRYSVRVEFLDCIAWVALKIEQVIKMEVKDSKGGWQLSTFRFNLLKPMQTASWIDQVFLAWIGEIVITFPEYAEQVYGWLHEELAKRFQNETSLHGIRQQVIHHMTVDSRMISALLHIKRQAGMRQTLMNTEIDEIWPKADFWAELHEKYPGLTLLCHLAAKAGNGSAIRNVSEVRSTCLRHGLSPSGWRYLIGMGEASYRAVVNSGISDAKAFPMAIGIIEMQSRSGLKKPLPEEMALAFVNFSAMAMLEGLNIVEHVDPRIVRVGSERFFELEQAEDRAQFVEKDWLGILVWLRNERPHIDKNQWRSGWPCIWRKYQAWLGERDTTVEWESRVNNLCLSGMKVKSLTSSTELCLEGMKMNHCISTYARECRNGTYLVFSIREETAEKRIATVGLKFEGNFWKLDQVKGKNNRRVSPEVESLSRSLARFYQQTYSQYEARTRLSREPNLHRESVRGAGHFHLKVSHDNCLMTRNSEDCWVPAQCNEYPISSELRSCFELGRIEGSSAESQFGAAELTLRLRLELPSEFSIYIWDAAANRDRLLMVDC